ncbi:MAG: methyltransferase [Pseudomonadota bacterium]
MKLFLQILISTFNQDRIRSFLGISFFLLLFIRYLFVLDFHNFALNWATTLDLLFSLQLIYICFLFFIRATPIKRANIFNQGIAFCSCIIPLFYTTNLPQHFPSSSVSLFLVFAGYLLSFWGLISLGRSFGVTPAYRKWISSQAYRYLDHPIYLGHFMAEAGFTLWFPNTANFWILLTSLGLYTYRAVLEQQLIGAQNESV